MFKCSLIMYWIRTWNKTCACLWKSREPTAIISRQKNRMEIAEEIPLSVCSDSYLWLNEQKALPCYCVFLSWNGFGHLWQFSVVLRAMGWDSSKMQHFNVHLLYKSHKVFLYFTFKSFFSVLILERSFTLRFQEHSSGCPSTFMIKVFYKRTCV